MNSLTIFQKNIKKLERIIVSNNAKELGEVAGREAAKLINAAIKEKGFANIILATGASQFETLKTLVNEKVDWSKVTMFHLDEYIDLPESSPASFRRYLKERFLQKVPPLKAAYLINGEVDPGRECARLNEIIKKHPIDVALVGIGENGHLAFNDPPADFDIGDPYLVVELDDDCRQQQFGEGWFPSINNVPRQAISMSVKQICKSEYIICSVPDQRKAKAVKNSLEQSVNNMVPATILQSHANCTFFLDRSSSSLLTQTV